MSCDRRCQFCCAGKIRRLALAALLIPGGIQSADLAGPSGNPPGTCSVATLRNGFSIQYSRYERVGVTTRLWLCTGRGSGYVDVPVEQLENYEPAETQVVTETPEPANISSNAGISSEDKNRLGGLITSIATRYQIDPDFIDSLVKAESHFNSNAISPKGARGLMQLMPDTAARLGVKNLFDPAANLDGGARYLRGLLEQYHGDAAKALAAYNAGPQRVRQYGGIPPYPETLSYVRQVITDFNRRKLQQRAQAQHTP